ncbi:MAG: hypothetical protein AAF485_08935, partial [Chloroflexota bacterium]
MRLKRSSVVVSGGIGLLACCLLTAITLFFRPSIFPLLPAYLTMAPMMWGIFLFLMALALLEIPLMIYGVRKIMEGKSTRLKNTVLALNSFFVFFPIVYAVPNLLMSAYAQLWMGFAISATALLRFIASY